MLIDKFCSSVVSYKKINGRTVEQMKEKKEYNWKAAVDENLRMGFTELIILHLLSERDMYGYEIRKTVGERTNGAVTFSESSLYIPLLRMASRDLISSRREIVVGKRFRTYYHIEELGKKYHEYGIAQCKSVISEIFSLLTEGDIKK